MHGSLVPLHSALSARCCSCSQRLQRPATVAQLALAAGAPTPASHSALSRPVLAAPVHVQHSMGPRPTSTGLATADGLSLPARSISSLSSLFLVLRAILVDVAPARQTLANTLRTGERLRGESDGLGWQTPGQLARTLPPTLRPRGPVLSLQKPLRLHHHAEPAAPAPRPASRTRHHTKRPGPLSQRPRLETACPSTLKTRIEPGSTSRQSGTRAAPRF